MLKLEKVAIILPCIYKETVFSQFFLKEAFRKVVFTN
jgi:hypothetical protein